MDDCAFKQGLPFFVAYLNITPHADILCQQLPIFLIGNEIFYTVNQRIAITKRSTLRGRGTDYKSIRVRGSDWVSSTGGPGLGITTTKVVPSPNSECREISPFIFCTAFRVMYKPKPEPKDW